MQLTTPAPDERPADGGFTLIELLIAISLLAVITLPLGNAIIGFVRNQGATTDRLALNHDAQISAAYFARDVASVGMHDYAAVNAPLRASIQLNAAYDAEGYPCGTAATPAAKIRFLSDDWDDSGPTPVARAAIVAYYLQPAGTVSELHRIKCVGSATPVSDVVLAHNVDPGTPAVTCSSTCDAAAVPQSVTLTFTVTKPSVGPYDVSLNGQRRQT